MWTQYGWQTSFLVLLLILLVVFVLSLMLRRFPAPPAPAVERKPVVRVFKFLPIAPLPSDYVLLTEESESSDRWASLMQEIGAIVEKAGVRRSVFVHGTFVGNDPMSMLESFRHALPDRFEQGASWAGLNQRLQKFAKFGSDRLIRDLGNFPPKYVLAFQRRTGIPAESWTWSSANHHAARLVGAVELACRLVESSQGRSPAPGVRENDRILLWGHSHAGQLFSLLSRLAADVQARERMLEVYGQLRPRTGREELRRRLGFDGVSPLGLESLNLDFVTLGTPVRYPFQPRDNWRIVHLINDRSHATGTPIDSRAAFRTRDGDYVQHWATAGSDASALHGRLRALNRELDGILDIGIDFKYLQRLRADRRHLHAHGVNVLVDYGDAGSLVNFAATAFGHGTYTRLPKLLFNIALVAHLLYGGPSPEDWAKAD